MLKIKRTILLLMVLIFGATITLAADVNFPYSSIRLKLTPASDPFSGLGTYYSTLSKGMQTALWNPASLGKLKLAESSFALLTGNQAPAYLKTFNINEITDNLNVGSGSSSGAGQIGIFFRPLANIGSGLNTKEVSVQSTSNYASESTGLNFSAAQKINDWLSIGFSSQSPFAADWATAGSFPTVGRVLTNFYNQSIDKTQITSDGKLKYTYTSGATTTTYETTGSIWSGFISQEVTMPTTSISQLSNDMQLQTPFISTIASKFDNFSFGANIIPISATANIDNTVKTIVDSNASNQYIYVPNFDPTNPVDIASWASDPSKYGASAGYSGKQINMTPGELVGTAVYRGFYSANTTRFDIGTMYDVNDWFTVGLVRENATGASLNFVGDSISTFMSYRQANTAETENLNNLFLPGGSGSIDLLTDRWAVTNEAQGKAMYLEPVKNCLLAQKMRIGVSFKKPILIALDYEQNQSPIVFNLKQENTLSQITVSNINLYRIGLETQIFNWPAWFRIGTTLMPKPTITGLNAANQQSVNGAFSLGFLPMKLDLGTDFKGWDYIYGLALGFNALPIINLVQLDGTNSDLSKILFLSTHIGKDAWEVNYIIQADLAATAAAYGSKTVPAGQTKSFEMSDLRYVQMLGATYRF